MSNQHQQNHANAARAALSRESRPMTIGHPHPGSSHRSRSSLRRRKPHLHGHPRQGAEALGWLSASTRTAWRQGQPSQTPDLAAGLPDKPRKRPASPCPRRAAGLMGQHRTHPATQARSQAGLFPYPCRSSYGNRHRPCADDRHFKETFHRTARARLPPSAKLRESRMSGVSRHSEPFSLTSCITCSGSSGVSSASASARRVSAELERRGAEPPRRAPSPHELGEQRPPRRAARRSDR